MADRALILANGTFTDPQIPHLKSPVVDGRRLEELLKREDVWPYEVSLCDDLSAQEMRIAVGDFFHEAAHDDQLLLYVSGHGLKDAAGKLYFAARDTLKSRLKATALETRFIVECMQECPAQRQLLFLDTCFSGAFAKGVTFKATAHTVVKDDFEGDGSTAADWTGRGVVTAGTAVQLAQEFETDGVVQSLFTRHLISGIQAGSADRKRSGTIMLDELVGYIRTALKNENAAQTPQIFGEKVVGKIVVARNPVPVSLPSEIAELLASEEPLRRGLAIDRLARIARLDQPALAPLALEKLRSLERDDDSILIQTAAQRALRIVEAAEAGARLREQDRLGKEAEKAEAEKAAEAERQRQVIEEERRCKEVDQKTQAAEGLQNQAAEARQNSFEAIRRIVRVSLRRKPRGDADPTSWKKHSLPAFAALSIAIAGISGAYLLFVPGKSREPSAVPKPISPKDVQPSPAPSLTPRPATDPATGAPFFTVASRLEGTWRPKGSEVSECADGGVRVRRSADGKIAVNDGEFQSISLPDSGGWVAIDGRMWRLLPEGILQVNQRRTNRNASEFELCK